MTEKTEFNCDAADFPERNEYDLVHYCTYFRKEPNGTVTENTVETRSKGKSTHYESVYNKDSLLMSYELFNEMGAAILKEEYIFDDKRNLSEYHSYRKQKLESKKKYAYDHMHLLKLAEEHDGQGSLMSRYVFEYEKY